MDSIPKPPGFGHLPPADYDDDRPVQSPKPEAPTHFDYGPSTSSKISEEIDDSKKDHGDFRGFTVIEHPKEGETGTDFGVKDVFNVVKSLDANRYATKKTIAQGMLDIALLTANASQLKYILQVGKQHEFYYLMLTLICVSIGLQVLQGIIFVLLGSSFNINKTQDQQKANVWNNISVLLMVLTVAVNVIISAFEMRDTDHMLGNNSTAVKGADEAALLNSPGIR